MEVIALTAAGIAKARAEGTLPTTARGSILPARLSPSSYLAPGWDVFTAQQRTVRVDALKWPRIYDTADDMMRDSQVQGLAMSLFLPIRHMQWYVDPKGTTGTVAEEIAQDFGLPLLGEILDEDGPGIDHDEHLRTALLALMYGHQGFEEQGIIEGNGTGAKYRLRSLHERYRPQRIDVTSDGELISIRTDSADPHVDGPFVDLPSDHLLYYCWDQRGADAAGHSLLTGLYRAWLLKDEQIREDAMMTRRFGGIPVVEVTDPSVGQGALDDAAMMAQRLQAGDGAGVAMPYGTRLRILGVEGTLPKPLDSVKYHDSQMARAFMQMVMELGNSQHGSRALGTTLMDHYALGVLSIAKWVAKTQMALVKRIVERNYGVGAPLPHIRYRQDDHEDIAIQDLVALVDSGAIVVDDDLEAQIRSRGNLVPRNPVQAGRVPPADVPPPAPVIDNAIAGAKAKPKKRHEHPSLEGFEDAIAAAIAVPPPAGSPGELSGADFAALQAAFLAARAELVAAWDAATAVQITDLTAQIRSALSVTDLSALTPSVTGSAELAAALVAVVEHGAQTVIDEAASQGHTITVPSLAVAQANAAAAADATAQLLARSLGTSAASKALALWTGPDSASAVADAVGVHLRGLAGTNAEYELSGLASQAQNGGRFAAMDVLPVGTSWYASALIEQPNVCEPCRVEDGDEFATMSEVRRDFPAGSYVGCLGGKRCRCVVVAVLPSEGTLRDLPVE